METYVMIPKELSLAISTSTAKQEYSITVWAKDEILKGSLFYPFHGTVRFADLNFFGKLDGNDVRYKFGLFEDISYSFGKYVRYCNWIRFVRTSDVLNSNVNMICATVKGEPIYEAIKTIAPNQELVIFYLREQSENASFLQKKSLLYKQAMSAILYGSPLDLSTSLIQQIVNLPISPVSSEDEQKSSLQYTSISATYKKGKQCDDLDDLTKMNKTIGNEKQVVSQAAKKFIKNNRGERSLLPCEICAKAFDRPSLLKRHMRTHTGEKPHVCLVCGKGFSTSSSLNTHRRIHSGEKPHECNVCGKRFTASSNLYYHRMTHIKEKPHKCSLCAKSFPTPGDLKSHMYTHNGSWPFKCQICFRGFSKQTNLKNHLFLHTGDKPHGCSICNKRFALSCNLRAHMKTHSENFPDKCDNKNTSHSADEILNNDCFKCCETNSVFDSVDMCPTRVDDSLSETSDFSDK